MSDPAHSERRTGVAECSQAVVPLLRLLDLHSCCTILGLVCQKSLSGFALVRYPEHSATMYPACCSASQWTSMDNQTRAELKGSYLSIGFEVVGDIW